MAIAMTMTWDDVPEVDYDQLRELVGWESTVPHGAQFHMLTNADLRPNPTTNHAVATIART